MCSIIRLVLLLLCLSGLSCSTTRSLSIHGRLLCGEYPAFSTLIRIWNTDKKSTDISDILVQDHTGKDGHFNISLSTELENPIAVMKIYHDCDDGVKPGQRVFKFTIPKKYFKEDGEYEPYHFGILNLETRIKSNEERRIERRAQDGSLGLTLSKLKRRHLKSDESPEDRIEPW